MPFEKVAARLSEGERLTSRGAQSLKYFNYLQAGEGILFLQCLAVSPKYNCLGLPKR